MSYHMDREVNSAMIRLLDALCEFERNSGRKSTLVLIPHCEDERIVLAQDGKPLPESDTTNFMAKMIFDMALTERNPIGRLFKEKEENET